MITKWLVLRWYAELFWAKIVDIDKTFMGKTKREKREKEQDHLR